ncbi:MAG TPA: tetratricopeptide repeat protein [Candidatus Obscuribacter sp.]|nr:tetratricopeptide repeat protein [Candidatus Obscuribacter sp.]
MLTRSENTRNRQTAKFSSRSGNGGPCSLLPALFLSVVTAAPGSAQNQIMNQPPPNLYAPAPPPTSPQTTQQAQPGLPALKGNQGARDNLDILYLGRGHYAGGRLPEALAAFQEFARLKPNNLAAHFWLGTVYDELGRPREALDEYSQALRLAGSVGMDSPELRINLGNRLAREGYLKESLFDYQRSLVIDKRYALAYLGVAKCLLAQGDNQGALKALDQYQQAGGNDVNAILLRGLTLASLGRGLEAQYHLRLFLKQAIPGLENTPGRASTAGGVNTSNEAVELARKTLSTISDL